MASSGAMMAQTFSFTIPQSPGMDIALCKRETSSSLKLSRGRKVPRRPMFRNLAVERPRIIRPAGSAPPAGHLFWQARKVKEVEDSENNRVAGGVHLVEQLLSRSAFPLLPFPSIPHLPSAARPIISFHHGQQTDRTYPSRNGAASGN